MAGRFEFSGLREVFAKANEEKSGDRLAGIAAGSEQERVAAKRALADVPLRTIAERPLIAAEEDEVTRLIADGWDEDAFRPVAELTVGEFREFLLHETTDEATLRALRWGVTPEMAAAVTKLMSNRDLALGASKIRNVTRCRNTMGERGVLGIRLQPNHPADDVGGILLAAVEGLFYGCGDAVIGVNPATDAVQSVASILRALDGADRTVWDSDPGVLPGAHDDAAGGDGGRRAGGFALPVGGRDGGGEPQLWDHAGDAAGGPRAGAGVAWAALGQCELGWRAGYVF